MRARIPSIQALRAIAALLVVVHHAAMIGPAPGPLLQALPSFDTFCAVGVDIFFVISGFVMAHSIGEAADGLTPGRFLARRAIRIVPLFWLVNAAQLVIDYGLYRATPDSLRLLNGITILPLMSIDTFQAHPAPVYVSWSLGFELIFYVLAAFAIRLRPSRPVPLLLGVTVVLAGCGAMFSAKSCLLAFAANPIVAEFTLGMAGWLIWRSGRASAAARLLVPLGVLFFVAGLTFDIGQGFSVDPGLVLRGETSAQRALIWGGGGHVAPHRAWPANPMPIIALCGQSRDWGIRPTSFIWSILWRSCWSRAPRRASSVPISICLRLRSCWWCS
jgi:exopolysaccharide production protein ExoZ